MVDLFGNLKKKREFKSILRLINRAVDFICFVA